MNELIIRKAISQDKDTVLGFCKNTWEWGDYISDVWDIWVHDNKGELIVTLLDSIPRAIIHLKVTIDNDGWLEGLRVDPSFCLKGIADEICRYALDIAAKRHLNVVRCFILESNIGSRKIGERIGFQPVCRMYSYWSQYKKNNTSRLTKPNTDQVDELWHMIKNSDVYNSSSGLYLIDWVYLRLSREKIAEHTRNSEVFLIGEGKRIQACAIVLKNSFGGGKTVGYLDGEPNSIDILINELRTSHLISECDHLEASVPGVKWIIENMKKPVITCFLVNPPLYIN